MLPVVFTVFDRQPHLLVDVPDQTSRVLQPGNVDVAVHLVDALNLENHMIAVTDHGMHTAMFLTGVHDRLLPTGLAHLAERSSTPGPLRTAATAYQNAIDNLTNATGLAA